MGSILGLTSIMLTIVPFALIAEKNKILFINYIKIFYFSSEFREKPVSEIISYGLGCSSALERLPSIVSGNSLSSVFGSTHMHM